VGDTISHSVAGKWGAGMGATEAGVVAGAVVETAVVEVIEVVGSPEKVDVDPPAPCGGSDERVDPKSRPTPPPTRPRSRMRREVSEVRTRTNVESRCEQLVSPGQPQHRVCSLTIGQATVAAQTRCSGAEQGSCRRVREVSADSGETS